MAPVTFCTSVIAFILGAIWMLVFMVAWAFWMDAYDVIGRMFIGWSLMAAGQIGMLVSGPFLKSQLG